MRRELKGNKIFKCWTCKEYGHYSSKCPKKVKKYKNLYKWRTQKDCLFANQEEFHVRLEEFLSESDDESDEMGFFSIKKESPKK